MSVDCPTIDLGAFRADSTASAEEVARSTLALRLAAESGGFFYAVNSGIIEAMEIEQSLAAADTLWALDSCAKEALKVRRDAANIGFTRGYISIGGESGSDLLECKEAFSYGHEPRAAAAAPPRSHRLEGPNRWPSVDDVGEAWQPMMSATFDAFCRVSALVSRGLSLALGEEIDFLQRACGEGGDRISLMRLFHYFPCLDPKCDAAFAASPGGTPRIGSSPHTDWGFITLVAQSDDAEGERGGLEVCVENPLDEEDSTKWVRIPPRAGSLVVNCGDWVSLFSGGRIKSPLHRVVNGSKPRNSLVFFAYPAYDAPLPKLSGGGGAAAELSLLTDQSRDSEGGAERGAEGGAGCHVHPEEIKSDPACATCIPKSSQTREHAGDIYNV